MAYNLAEIEAYIRQQAIAKNINPDTAVAIAKREGLLPGLPTGDEGLSGPFQLYTGKKGGGGLGTEFRQQTGLDPLDRKNTFQTIDFALDKANAGGWGPWYGRLANPKRGLREIGVWEGINRVGRQSEPPQVRQRAGMGQGGGIASALPQDVQVSPAGGPPEKEQEAGIFGQLGEMYNKLNYGGVPFNQRLMVLGHVLQSLGAGKPTDPNVMGRIGQYEQQSYEREVLAQKQAKLKVTAQHIYNNLKDSNPQLAQYILDNYEEAVPKYIEGQLTLDTDLTKKAQDQFNTVKNKYLDAGLSEKAADAAAKRDLAKLKYTDVLDDEDATVAYKRELVKKYVDSGYSEKAADAAAGREITKLKIQNVLTDEDKTTEYQRKLADEYRTRGFTKEDADAAAKRDIDKLKVQHGFTMEEKEFDVKNTPDAVARREWNATWFDYLQKNDLTGASTEDIYRRYFKDPKITPQEGERLGAANVTLKDLREEYRSIIDDRTNATSASAAEIAAKVAGIELGENAYIVNQAELLADKTGKVKPIIAYAEGSKQAAEAKAAEEAAENAKKYDAIKAHDTTMAIDRAIATLDAQESGESLTGAGWTGILGPLPGPHGAGDLYDDVQTIKANMGLEQLAAIRRSNPNGGALGPVSDYENRMLQSTIETLNTTRDPKMLKARLQRLKDRYAAAMTASTTDPTKSVATVHAEALVADPSPEAQHEFDELYGPGAAKAVMEGKPGPAVELNSNAN